MTGVFIHVQLHSSDQDQQIRGLLVTGDTEGVRAEEKQEEVVKVM